MRIIGLCGFKGSGKTFTANRMKAELEKEGKTVKLLSFADGLREMTYKLIGKELNVTQYNEFKVKEFKMELSDITITFTGRELLQKFGTNILRNINEDIWIDIMYEKIFSDEIFNKFDTIIIDDVRFSNEESFIKQLQRSNIEVNIEVLMMFCDFKSHLYNDQDQHESEDLARALKRDGWKDQDIMWGKYLCL